MAINYEQDTCNGRGFANDSADGFLANFAAWVVRTPVASPVSKSTGGPGWYIIDDQSTVSGTPNKYAYIETSNYGLGSLFDTIAEAQAVTDGEFTLVIDGVSEDITGLDFSGDSDWDDVASTMQIAIRAASNGANDGFEDAVVQWYSNLNGQIPLYNDTELVVRFRIVPGEPGMTITASEVSGGAGTGIYGSSYLYLGTLGLYSTDPYIVISDQAAPTAYSGAKFLRVLMPTTTSGAVYVYAYMYWNATIHKGFGFWGGWKVGTYDDSEFAYDFRGGTDFLIIASRLGATWNHVVIDSWEDDSNLVEDNTKVGNIVSDVAVGATSIEVGVGEGVNFTDGNFYFLVDLDNSEAVAYVKIDGISTDTLTLHADYSLQKSFKSGALLTPYYQRFWAWGLVVSTSNYVYRTIPFRSERGKEFGNYSSFSSQYCYSEMIASYLTSVLTFMAPDDENQYAVMKPLVLEDTNSSYYEGNRAYGNCKSAYIGAVGTMAQMLNGRTISAKEYIYLANCSTLANNSDLAILVPHYNEV